VGLAAALFLESGRTAAAESGMHSDYLPQPNRDLAAATRQADILVAAVGIPELKIGHDQTGRCLIDAGIIRVEAAGRCRRR